MHKCTYCVFSCVDFRFQKTMEKLLTTLNVEYGDFDRVSIPGGAGDTESSLKYVELSVKLHKSKVYILTAHEDCGTGKTLEDLISTIKIMKALYPDKIVKGYFLKLNGSWNEVK
jgi:hypothetical protein